MKRWLYGLMPRSNRVMFFNVWNKGGVDRYGINRKTI